MIATLKLFLATISLYALADSLWINFIAKDLYVTALGKSMRNFSTLSAVQMGAGLATIVLIVAGSILFVAPRLSTPLYSFMWGAAYGFVVYGTYGLTNYVIFSDWPFSITLFDTLWGIFLNGCIGLWLYTIINYI